MAAGPAWYKIMALASAVKQEHQKNHNWISSWMGLGPSFSTIEKEIQQINVQDTVWNFR